ncbi:hypothetical protein BDV23DRAFT_147191 [Aspergillus alliaceus]|uniref:Uncharacterized protein n=1 Tax=Petromyces alliaceus TaxID=209559 RepID=A0A5N7CJR2_PETAA|nr:hypothetical protein BDV23DRAFT_147191 [Aspergillus alliaceus]
MSPDDLLSLRPIDFLVPIIVSNFFFFFCLQRGIREFHPVLLGKNSERIRACQALGLSHQNRFGIREVVACLGNPIRPTGGKEWTSARCTPSPQEITRRPLSYRPAR